MTRRDVSTRQVLEACERFTRANQAGLDIDTAEKLLMAATGAPLKVVYAALEREATKGAIEYGVSLRTSWLTERGKAILAAARAKGERA